MNLLLLIAYGFNLRAFKLRNNYIVQWKQRTKINQAYDSWNKYYLGYFKGLYLDKFYQFSTYF